MFGCADGKISNIWYNESLTFTYMQLIFAKIRLWTHHISKVKCHMLVCSSTKKPSNMSSDESMIKR